MMKTKRSLQEFATPTSLTDHEDLKTIFYNPLCVDN
jgi:hypothetical protein